MAGTVLRVSILFRCSSHFPLHRFQIRKMRSGKLDPDVIHEVKSWLDAQRLKNFSNGFIGADFFKDPVCHLVNRNPWTGMRNRRRTELVVPVSTDIVSYRGVVFEKSGVKKFIANFPFRFSLEAGIVSLHIKGEAGRSFNH